MKKKKKTHPFYPTPMARALFQNPCFKPRVIQKATGYNRNKIKKECHRLFQRDD